jgi:hypothetical protein
MQKSISRIPQHKITFQADHSPYAQGFSNGATEWEPSPRFVLLRCSIGALSVHSPHDAGADNSKVFKR